MAIMVVLLLASALLLMTSQSRPQPIKARRNMLQEDVLAAFAEERSGR